MYKYSWSLYKTLDYINSRRPNLNLNPNFVHQLVVLQKNLIERHHKTLTNTWNENSEDPEDLVLRNTYLNAKIKGNELIDEEILNDKEFVLTWSDENFEGNNKKVKNPEGNIIVTRSCFKGQKSRIFEFECKPLVIENNSMISNKSWSATKKQTILNKSGKEITPLRNSLRRDNKKLSNQENLTKENLTKENNNPDTKEKIIQRSREKRSNSARPPSPMISGNKLPMNCIKKILRPWK